METVNPLRLRRLAKGMTQADLAKAAGISQQLLSKLESGKIRISAPKAVQFAELLDCRPAELLPALAMSPQPETKNTRELMLLEMFRSLNDEQQDILYNLASLMVSKEKQSAAAN